MDFDICLKLVVHSSVIHSGVYFVTFICQLLLLLLSYISHLFLHRNHLRISLVTVFHFLFSLLTLPTLSLMRAQVASASSNVSKWGLLTNMVGMGGVG